MKQVKIYHLSPKGDLAEGESLGCISVYLKSDYDALREERDSFQRVGIATMEKLHACEQRLTAAEQRNAEIVAILSEHEWTDWEPYDSYNNRAGGCYCIECGNHKEVGHDDHCKIAAALKPTEWGVSE